MRAKRLGVIQINECHMLRKFSERGLTEVEATECLELYLSSLNLLFMTRKNYDELQYMNIFIFCIYVKKTSSNHSTANEMDLVFIL